MKNTLSFLTGLVLLAQPNLALAQACKMSTLSDFGALALGASTAKVPKTFVLEDNCDRTQLNPHGACNWMDPKTGIEYSGSDGKIFRKQIEMTEQTIARPLPFGLRPTDRPADVARKLKALKNAPVYDVGADTISSKGCLRTPAVKSFSLDISFGGDGLLKTISVATPTQ